MAPTTERYANCAWKPRQNIFHSMSPIRCHQSPAFRRSGKHFM